MRKYKLAKDDVLGKTVLASKGELDNYDIKLHLSLFISKLILEYGADKLPEDIYTNLSIIFTLGAFAEVIFCITDKKRRDNAKNKLNRLKKELEKLEFKIDVDNPGIWLSFDEGSETLFFNNTRINYDNEKYRFVDSEKFDKASINNSYFFGEDVSDVIYKTLLPKRKYKKYEKSKQNK